MAETFASRLTSFEILEEGSLTDRRVFANLSGYHPDGICLVKVSKLSANGGAPDRCKRTIEASLPIPRPPWPRMGNLLACSSR